MSGKQKKYPAKLLLFGEYAVLDGGQALAIPYEKYFGYWDYLAQAEQAVFDLRPFVEYLKDSTLSAHLDLIAFAKEVDSGLLFRSTIPMGYGAGSSGAFCAAVWDRYNKDSVSIKELKSYFMVMEAFFHGKSSGVDPLVSYLNRPIITGGASFAAIQVLDPILLPKSITVFDSKIARRTEPLVNWYKKELIANTAFKKQVFQVLIPTNTRGIQALIHKDEIALKRAFETISHWQFEFFIPLIPDIIQPMWQQAWSKEISYKLCGAGGGGFFLVHE